MSTKAHHLEIDWPQNILAAALASAVSTFILAGDIPPNLSDLAIGMGLLLASQLAASYILHSLSTRHGN